MTTILIWNIQREAISGETLLHVTPFPPCAFICVIRSFTPRLRFLSKDYKSIWGGFELIFLHKTEKYGFKNESNLNILRINDKGSINTIKSNIFYGVLHQKTLCLSSTSISWLFLCSCKVQTDLSAFFTLWLKDIIREAALRNSHDLIYKHVLACIGMLAYLVTWPK